MAKLGLIIPLAIVGTLALAVGGVYLSIMDHTESDFVPEQISNDELINRQLVRSLKDTKTSKKIDYKFDQNCLNQMLSNAANDVKKDLGDASQYVGDIYCEINGNSYRFYVGATLPVIKTRLIIDTTLVSTNENYEFQINSINAGRFPAYWILEQTGVLNNLPIEKAFKEAGLSIKVDRDNNKLVYKKADMETDLLAMMSSGADDMLQGALDSIDFEFKFDGGICATGNLEKLQDNPSKSDSRPEGSHYANYSETESHIANTMNQIVAKYGQAVSDELVNNFANDEFAKLQDLNTKGDDVSKIIKDRITSVDYTTYALDTGYNRQVAHISEAELDSLLLSTGIIGRNFLFHHKTEAAYVVVDKFYSDIFQDEQGDTFINYTIGININGLETRAILETKCEPIANSFMADFSITNVYFGSVIADEDFAKVAKDYFCDAVDTLADRDAWLIHEKGSDTIRIDFDKMVAEDDALADYDQALAKDVGTRTFKISNANVNGDGQIQIWFARA